VESAVFEIDTFAQFTAMLADDVSLAWLAAGSFADATVAEFRHLLEQPVAQLTAATEP